MSEPAGSSSTHGIGEIDAASINAALSTAPGDISNELPTPPMDHLGDTSKLLSNLPEDLKPLFPRTPAEIDEIVKRATTAFSNVQVEPIGVHAEDELDVERVLRESIANTNETQAGKESDNEINADEEDEINDKLLQDWTTLSAKVPSNLPIEFPPSFYEPYTEIAEPSQVAATGEFESLLRFQPPVSDPVPAVEGDTTVKVEDPLIASVREQTRELRQNLSTAGVDDEVSKFMEELTMLGEDPTYEDPFETLDLEGYSPFGAKGVEFDEAVGELGDYAANSALFEHFATLLRPEEPVLNVDEIGVFDVPEHGIEELRNPEEEWAQLERQAERDASAGVSLDIVSDMKQMQDEADRVFENDEMEPDEGRPESVLLGFDPWNETYVFSKDNPARSMVPEEALEKALASLKTEAPETIEEFFEAALDPAPGREGLEDAGCALAWLHLGLHHVEQGNVKRAIPALRASSALVRAESDLELSSERHPTRVACRAVAELATLYGSGLDSRRALSLIRRWLELANESWGEDMAMDLGDENENDDDELALTDVLRARLRETLKKREDDADAHSTAHIVHLLARDRMRSADALLAAAHARPTSPLAWRRLAATLPNSTDATRALRRAADLRPFDPRSWTRVGAAYSKHEKHDRAAAYLLRGLALHKRALDEVGPARFAPQRARDLADAWNSLAMSVRALGHEELVHHAQCRDIEAFRAYFHF